MRVALLADIHSNLEALRACLAHAAARGADAYALLGDLVGYGADPVPCLDIVQDLAARGARVVLGNHDQACLSGLCESMAFVARDAVYYTRDRLTERHRAFLRGLPLTARDEDILFVHASAEEPGRWTYVTDAAQAARCLHAAQARLTVTGHVHHPILYYTGSRGLPRSFHPTPGVAVPLLPTRHWLAIVGSVGQPRDGHTASCYALLDRDRNTLTYFRVPYDHFSAARKVRAAGLPERLARRLETGH